MPSHDPFSPESAAAPPTDGVKPSAQDSDPNLSVLQPDEQSIAPAAPSPAPEAPETPAAQETTNDTPTATPDAQPPVEGQQTPAQETSQLEVKVGTSREVMDWVNEAEGDERTARAQAALDVERASSEPRKGLSHELEELLGGNN